MKFKESALAHQLLDGLTGLEIGGSAHNAFGLNTQNVDYTDDMTTIFKQQEITLCGEAMPVDIVAPGDNIPLPDKSVDFVISSHVIEHFWDPIAAIKEWIRLSKKYIFIICPQPTALESDREKEITPLQELLDRHEGTIPAPEEDTHEHYTRWTAQTFCNMCMAMGWEILTAEDPDQKVGNGFTIVLKVPVESHHHGSTFTLDIPSLSTPEKIARVSVTSGIGSTINITTTPSCIEK